MHANSTTPAIETKSFETDDHVSDLNRVFAAFRETNDERLAQIEQRLSADVVTEEKLSRIDRALDETKRRLDTQIIQKSRPHYAAETRDVDPQAREHKAAFRNYMRSGEAHGLKAVEEKAMSASSAPNGGFLVPVPVERDILDRMAVISPVRALATVREVSGSGFRKSYPTVAAVAGWVGELDARPQTNSPQLADMNFPAAHLYAMPSATQTLLEDASIDLDSWLASELDMVFAEQESAAFVTGNGVNRPTGFLNYTKSTVAAWGWSKTAYVPTGVAGAFAATNPLDVFVDLIYSLRDGYRQNASFMMNRRTQAAVRKMKTTTGEYMWQPPTALRQPATLMNFPVYESEHMPDIATDSFSVAFADFRRAYLVVDRTGIRVLRDPYTAKPYVLFYTTKRVGGGVQDFDAIKLLKFGAA